MKAVRLYKPAGYENLISSENPGRSPGAGEIRVRLHASSINYHDYLVVTGKLAADDARIPMSDGAGEVVELGTDVSEFAVGDRVISMFYPDWTDGPPDEVKASKIPGHTIDGYACFETTVPSHYFTRAPLEWSHAEAATLTCAGLTAWRALFVEGQLKPGEVVLVQGTGGVSIFALQLAKAAGARVLAISSSKEKIDRLMHLGADDAVNYREVKEWGIKIRQITGGRGVDHVIEIGGAGTLSQSIEACRHGGHISLIGVLMGFTGEVSTASIMARQQRVIGITVGNRAQQLAFVRAVESAGFHPIIDSVYGLESLGKAFQYQSIGRHFGNFWLQW